MLKYYISFENVIILKNTKIDINSKANICYNRDPLYIGTNLRKKSFLFHQYGVGIKVHSIPSKKIAIIVRKSKFDNILPLLPHEFIYVKVPDYHVKDLQQVNTTVSDYVPTEDEYVLLVMSSNENIKKKSQLHLCGTMNSQEVYLKE